MKRELAMLILALVLFSSVMVIVQNTHSEAQSDHDLSVTLQAPSKLLFPETGMVNLTVFNLGTNDENNVMIQIIINGTVKVSKTIPSLKSASLNMTSYLWTPETGGVYNITGYARPVVGEGNVQNNVAQKDVIVTVPNLVSVEPKSIVTTASIPGVVDVKVTVSNVEDLYSYQLKLNYNSSVLDWIPSDWREPDYVLKYTNDSGRVTDNGTGWVMVGAFLMGSQPTFNGNGTLANFKFKIINPGRSYLNLSDVILVDSYAQPMAPVFTSYGTLDAWTMIGNYRVVAEPEAYITYWNGTVNPNKIEMTLDGGTYCNLTIPLDAMKGPFEITIDNSRAGYSVDFNTTHAFLRFRYTQGVHNVRITEGARASCLASDLNNDGVVDIRDVFLIARDFGKRCLSP